ncbi:MAG: iron hydrogenase small subunit, partial [Spirochaetes bacterium]|nr:iron hydrogenase small subunit [Spirochaetota bacterium]
KGEADRPEMVQDHLRDVDLVLTTREFARLLKKEGIWLPDLENSTYDNQWMGEFSGAAEIFGTTGGVMEAALRTVYFVLKGEELPGIEYKAVRGLENLREAVVDLGEQGGKLKVAIAHGLKAARTIIEKIKNGEEAYHFIEVMGCPGGCMSGGGQPRNKKQYQENWVTRQDTIYSIDHNMKIRQSHNNPLIKKIYDEYLEKPNSHKAHHLLHTHYTEKKRMVKHTMKEIWEDIQKNSYFRHIKK